MANPVIDLDNAAPGVNAVRTINTGGGGSLIIAPLFPNGVTIEEPDTGSVQAVVLRFPGSGIRFADWIALDDPQGTDFGPNGSLGLGAPFLPIIVDPNAPPPQFNNFDEGIAFYQIFDATIFGITRSAGIVIDGQYYQMNVSPYGSGSTSGFAITIGKFVPAAQNFFQPAPSTADEMADVLSRLRFITEEANRPPTNTIVTVTVIDTANEQSSADLNLILGPGVGSSGPPAIDLDPTTAGVDATVTQPTLLQDLGASPPLATSLFANGVDITDPQGDLIREVRLVMPANAIDQLGPNPGLGPAPIDFITFGQLTGPLTLSTQNAFAIGDQAQFGGSDVKTITSGGSTYRVFTSGTGGAVTLSISQSSGQLRSMADYEAILNELYFVAQDPNRATGVLPVTVYARDVNNQEGVSQLNLVLRRAGQNDAPAIQGLDPTFAYPATPAGAVRMLDTVVFAQDAESSVGVGDWSGARITVAVTGGSFADHALGLEPPSGSGLALAPLTYSGSGPRLFTLTLAGADIGQLDLDQSAARMTVTFDSAATVTQATFNAVLSAVGYRYFGAAQANPFDLSIVYTVTDPDGASSNDTIVVTVPAGVTAFSPVIDFTAAGGITGDFDNDPTTPDEPITSLFVRADNSPGGGTVVVNNSAQPLTLEAFSPRPLSVTEFKMPDGGSTFINQSSRAYTVTGGDGQDSFTIDRWFDGTPGGGYRLRTEASYFDGGGQDNATNGDSLNVLASFLGNQPFRAATTLDLTQANAGGWSTVTIDWAGQGTTTDYVKNIERVSLGNGNDVVRSGSRADTDTASFTSSANLFIRPDFFAFLNEGDDSFRGGDGADVVEVGNGNDGVDGGGGALDMVSWRNSYFGGSSQGVSFNLSNVDAAGFTIVSMPGLPSEQDRIRNVEAYIGSNLDDTMVGDDGSNQFFDDEGADRLTLAGGNDLAILTPDGADDEVSLGEGNDILVDQFSGVFGFSGAGVDILRLEGRRSDYRITEVGGATLDWTGGLVREFSSDSFLRIEGLGAFAGEGVDHVERGVIERFLFLGDGSAFTEDDLLASQPNLPPVAVNDSFVFFEDNTVRLDVLLNDSDPENGPLTLQSIDLSGAPLGTTAQIVDNKLEIRPPQNYNGTFTIGYTVADAGGLTASATAELVVQPDNDAPVIAAGIGNQASPEDELWTYSIPEGFPVSAFSDPDGDVLTYAATLANGDPLPAWLSFDATTRTFSGEPPVNFNGDIALRVSVTDPSGLSVSQAFTLNITPVNDGPSLANPIPSVLTSPEDTPWTYTVPADTFSDPDGDPLTYAATLDNGDPLPSWLSFDAATRTFSGTPPQDFDGQIRLIVGATDPGGLGAGQGFTLDITPVNDAPVAPSYSLTLPEDGSVALDLSIISDVDSPNLSAELKPGGEPRNGEIVEDPANSQVLYVPNPNFNGTDSVTLLISDGAGGVTEQVITFTVTPVNDGPSLANPIPSVLTSPEDAPWTYTVPADTFSDPDGDPLTYAATLDNGDSLPSWLSFDAATRTFSGTPPQDFDGQIRLIVGATDPGGLGAGQGFTLDITPVNDAPVAPSYSLTLPEDGSVALDLSIISDVDSPNLSAELKPGGEPRNGEIVEDPANSQVLYVPNPNFNGTDSVTLLISDGAGGVTEQVITFTVTPVNDAAVITGARTGTVTEDSTPNTVTGNLDAADVDNTPDLWQAVTAPTVSASGYGSFTMTSAGVWTYALNNTNPTVNALNTGQTLTDSFVVRTIDGTQQTVTVTINGANDGPPVNVITGTPGNDSGISGVPSGILGGLAFVIAPIAFFGLRGTNGLDRIDAGAGDDWIYGFGGNDTVIGGDGNDFLFGDTGEGRDGFVQSLVFNTGAAGNDSILGGAGNDALFGGGGSDTLNGGSGADTLNGGSGRDLLTGGGGGDLFLFDDGDSGPAASARDVILDFSRAEGDRIDLSAIDGIADTPVDDPLALFAARAQALASTGGVFVSAVSRGEQTVFINTSATAGFEMAITVRTTTALQASDFIL